MTELTRGEGEPVVAELAELLLGIPQPLEEALLRTRMRTREKKKEQIYDNL